MIKRFLIAASLLIFLNTALKPAVSHENNTDASEEETKQIIQSLHPSDPSLDEKLERVMRLLDHHPRLVDYRWEPYSGSGSQVSLFDLIDAWSGCAFTYGGDVQHYIDKRNFYWLQLLKRGFDINHPRSDKSMNAGETAAMRLFASDHTSDTLPIDTLFSMGIDFEASTAYGTSVRSNAYNNPALLVRMDAHKKRQDTYREHLAKLLVIILEEYGLYQRDAGKIVIEYAYPSYKDLSEVFCALVAMQKIAPETPIVELIQEEDSENNTDRRRQKKCSGCVIS